METYTGNPIFGGVFRVVDCVALHLHATSPMSYSISPPDSQTATTTNVTVRNENLSL